MGGESSPIEERNVKTERLTVDPAKAARQEAAPVAPLPPPETGADVLCHALVSAGVDVVFGHPGGAILPFYDALFRCGAPRHVLMRHEQGAAHAADGYARATGRVGVCVATSGPGATNLVTGLAAALMDSVPVVAITGQVATTVMGTEAFQETDILGVTMPVTKHGFVVQSVDDLTTVVHEAFRIAQAGRPGPVLIDVPKDIQNAVCARANGGRPGRGRPEPDLIAADVQRAAELVNGAKRPLVMVGRGVVLAGVADLVLELAERANLPVTATLLGLDGFPATHPLCIGLPGMHGTERANRGIQRADVILGLGLRFDDRVTGPPSGFAPGATIIHLEIDPVTMGRTVRPAVRILGDLRRTLPPVAQGILPATHPAWWEELGTWPRAAGPLPPATGPLSGRGAARGLAAVIRETGAAVATDVGQHQMWIAQELLDAARGTHLTSGGLGAMGYALPAGFGAAVGRPDRPTWVVAGDGGFQMTQQELASVAEQRVPLKIAVFNNGFLGMVRQWQELFYQRRYSASTLGGPDLVLLAKAYGIPGRVVEREEELAPALAWAQSVDGPVLLDLRVEREECVYPMVPSGKALDELVTGPPDTTGRA
jgi:acetolactate synthase-1/2/3 large subunit